MKRRIVNKKTEEGSSDAREVAVTQTPNDESKIRKIITRTVAGAVMALLLALILRGGALYCILFGIIVQIELFRELVNVRYVEAKEKNMPLFRSLQWSWFVLAMLYCYGDNFHNFCRRHGHLMHLTKVTQYFDPIIFSLYCLIFIVTVLTFKKGLIRFQIGQMLWTLVTVALVVLQTKFLANCVMYGIFWFFFPMATVAANDVFAYVCGMAFGKRFIKTPFLALSPKKTWEGFIGAAIITMLFSFFFPVWLADIPWFTCPADKLSFIPDALSAATCDVNPIFLPHQYTIPNIFGVLGGYELTLLPIQIHGLAYGTFSSLVAPFGGFLASAIKRGYDIKDFDNIIPGHGGVMDRMDCQLIIHLFTYVHIKSFVMSTSLSGIGVSTLLSAAATMSQGELHELHEKIGALLQHE